MSEILLNNVKRWKKITIKWKGWGSDGMINCES